MGQPAWAKGMCPKQALDVFCIWHIFSNYCKDGRILEACGQARKGLKFQDVVLKNERVKRRLKIREYGRFLNRAVRMGKPQVQVNT